VIELQQELEGCQARCEQLRQQLIERTAQLDSQKRERNEEQRGHAAALNSLQSELQVMRSKYDQDLANWDLSLIAHTQHTETLEVDIIRLKQERDELSDQLNALRVECAEQADRADSVRRQLEARFTGREGEWAHTSCSHTRDLSEERSKGESLEAENYRLSTQTTELSHRVGELEEQLRLGGGGDSGLSQVRGQYEALLLEQQKWQAAKDELEQLNALLRQQLVDAAARHDQAQDGLRHQREEAVEKSHVLDREKQVISSSVTQLTDELDRTQQTADRNLSSEQLKRQMADSQVEALTVENQQLRDRLSQAQADMERIQSELAELRDGSSSASADLQRLKLAFGAERDALQTQIATLEQELRAVRQENSALQLQLDESRAENQDLLWQLAELKRKLEETTSLYEACLPRIQAMQKQLEDEGVKYLQLLKKHKMSVCISIYTMYIQLLTISTFKRWKEWADEQVLVRGAAELREITSATTSPKTAGGEATEYTPIKFDDWNINALDIHSMANEFGLGIDD